MIGTIGSKLIDRVALQIFTKHPWPGHVKTRLNTIMSPSESAQLHVSLAEACVDRFSVLPPRFKLEIWGDDSADLPFYRHFVNKYPRLGFRLQKGNDLGSRMAFALRSGLLRYNKVILIGTDCPVLELEHILLVEREMALRQFNLIAAEDGGYVLIASQSYTDAVFRNIQWGTPSVLQETLEAASRPGWSSKVNGCLWDVDDKDDFARYLKLPESNNR